VWVSRVYGFGSSKSLLMDGSCASLWFGIVKGGCSYLRQCNRYGQRRCNLLRRLVIL
jgi:hypothetical protein